MEGGGAAQSGRRMEEICLSFDGPAYVVPNASIPLDLQQVFRCGDPQIAGNERAIRENADEVSTGMRNIRR